MLIPTVRTIPCLLIALQRILAEPPLEGMPWRSPGAVVAVFDAISIALMKYTGYTKEQFAVIHPGGAVGDRLLGK